jgi:hypothetical protein
MPNEIRLGLGLLLSCWALTPLSGCTSATTVVQGTCGPGTMREGEICFGVDAGAAGGLRCGAGTVEVSGVCVLIGTDAGPPRDGAIAPGSDAGPSGPTLRCGAGTHVSGDECVPDADPACGPGTHVSGGECVPDGDPGLGYFDLRVPGTTFNADGYSDIPIFVIGRDASGAPYTGDVVLLLSRATAGNLDDSTPTLTTVGGTTYFTPCSATATGCLGSFEISLSLPSDPGTVLATSGPLTLVASSDVGSLAPCSGGGNVIFYDGDSADYIFSGRETIRVGMWSIDGSPSGALLDTVHVSVTPTDSSLGLWWDLYFTSSETGTPLREMVYEGAERWPFESPGHPGFDVSGDGRGCNMVTGRFQIHHLVMAGGSISEFAATFEHHCEGGSAALRGCVSYGP